MLEYYRKCNGIYVSNVNVTVTIKDIRNRINNQTNTEVQPKEGIPFAMDEVSLEELFFALMQVYKKELFYPHFNHELQFVCF